MFWVWVAPACPMWLPSCPLSLPVSLCLIICVCLYLYLCASLSQCFCPGLSICFSSYMGVRGRGRSFCLKVSLFWGPCMAFLCSCLFSMCPSVRLSVYPSIHLSIICLFLYFPFCLCLSFSLCVCLSSYLCLSTSHPHIPLSFCVFLLSLDIFGPSLLPHPKNSSPPEELWVFIPASLCCSADKPCGPWLYIEVEDAGVRVFDFPVLPPLLQKGDILVLVCPSMNLLFILKP